MKRYGLLPFSALVAAALMCVLSGSGASASFQAMPTAPVNADAVDPPPWLGAGTYRILATETASTGARVQIFRGTLKRTGSECMGVRMSGFTGMSCGIDVTGWTALEGQESSFRGHRMVSGLVSAAVAKVVVVTDGGRDVAVPIHDGTFFFDRGWGDRVIAYDASGTPIGGYGLEN